jgi:hypothetical protein
MNPQDYSRRALYRPPAAWYWRINNGSLGVLLTSLGFAPRDAVTVGVVGAGVGGNPPGRAAWSGLATSTHS